MLSALVLALGPAEAEAAPASPPPRASQSPAEAAPNAPATPAWARAYAQGHWSLAAGLIETVSEGSRTPWHWLHLARAREKLGQLVEALAAYERLRELTPPVDATHPNHRQIEASSGFGEVRRQADAEAEALAKRIPWAQIDLGGDVPPGAYLFVDQQWLTPDRVQSPYPVNPGWHTFLLESDGEVHAARRVHFEEGQNRQVFLRTPLHPRWGASTEVAARASMDQGASASAGARSQPSPSASSALEVSWSRGQSQAVEDRRVASLRLASYISLGVGVLGLGVGTGFTVAAVGKRNELIELSQRCGGNPCGGLDPELERASLQEELDSATAFASGAFVMGGLGLVTSGVLFLLQYNQGPKPAAQVAGVELTPLIGLGEAGVSGRF